MVGDSVTTDVRTTALEVVSGRVAEGGMELATDVIEVAASEVTADAVEGSREVVSGTVDVREGEVKLTESAVSYCRRNWILGILPVPLLLAAIVGVDAMLSSF